MAQRQFKSTDTSIWNEKYGNSSDGVYAPSTSTDAPIDSACTGTINTTSLSATNASFATGQLILIHQTRGTGAGQWELNKIASYTAGTITTSYSLIYGYVSGAQVLVMPQYSSGDIASGQTITGKAWNGTVGGIYAKFCNGTFTVAGTITGTGKGFRGGNGSGNIGIIGNSGEGTAGASVSTSSSANGNGGGGGADSGVNRDGAGGGNGTTGGTGGNSGASGGTTAGAAALTTMVFGGAGGGTSADNGANTGGNGGAIVIIIAKTITITGAITLTGTVGEHNATHNKDAGHGAGGSALLKGQVITLGSSLLTANGYSGGTGGTGGNGRIHADYLTSISGTTSPTIDSTQDASLLVDITGGSFLLNFI